MPAPVMTAIRWACRPEADLGKGRFGRHGGVRRRGTKGRLRCFLSSAASDRRTATGRYFQFEQ